jgi:branched-chain amino acid transport system ATP-binding protein
MLELKNYSAGYSKNIFLFDEISINIQPGQVIGIKGFNGCGKSTFLKGIINLTTFKKGSIYLNEVNITEMETSKIFRSNQLGYLSQRNRIFNQLTVSEHINLQLMYSHKSAIIKNNIFNKLFSYIESKKRMLASTLSGGEQLILNLICLMILNPLVLLLDEPSDSLDINIKEELNNLIQYWKENGKAILLVEQNIEFLNNFCSIIINLNNYEKD